jgi:hypothetical protein
LDRKGEERIEWFGRKNNIEERRGAKKNHKRNIRTINFISYTRKMTKSHQSQTFRVLEVLQCLIA